jgi:hypothetical protein
MASDRGRPRQPRQRRIDPLITGIGDGVAAGYRAVESVVVGANQSIRMRPAAPAAAAAAATRSPTRRRQASSRTGDPGTQRTPPTRSAPAPPPTTLLGEIADVAADVLDGLGDAVREVASHLTDDRLDDDALHHTLELEGAPKETATDEFLLTNTGPTALKGLTFAKTSLIGAARNPIAAGAVTLTPAGQGTTDRVRPGTSTAVTVAVKIPAGAAAGVYRGIVCAQFDSDDDRDRADEGPVSAWALIELHVLPTDPRPT